MDWPDIAKAYDLAAEDYAKQFADELDGKPFDRELLDRFALSMIHQGPVWDVGCGPAGQVTRYLADRNVVASGVDLSPHCIEIARQRQPGLTFRVGDMCRLPAADGSLAGIVAFYSVIHLPRERIPEALAEFRRVLVPGGGLLVAMHGGEGTIGLDEWFGRPIAVRSSLVAPDEITARIAEAGFTVKERHVREPYEQEYQSRRIYVWAEAGGTAESAESPGSSSTSSTGSGSSTSGFSIETTGSSG